MRLFRRASKTNPAPAEPGAATVERRRSPRFLAVFAIKWPGGAGRTVNISDHGVLFEADATLKVEPGASFRVTLDIPSSEEPRGKVHALIDAAVVRLGPASNGRQSIGAEMHGLRFG